MDEFQRKVIRAILDDINERLEKRPGCFDNSSYIISLKDLQRKTGINPVMCSPIVRKFLKEENKEYIHKNSYNGNIKYEISISREELKQWNGKYW